MLHLIRSQLLTSSKTDPDVRLFMSVTVSSYFRYLAKKSGADDPYKTFTMSVDMNDSLYQMLSEDMETPKRLLGYIRNSGSMPIRVSFTWGKQIEIKPGETVPVDPAVLEKYPDSQLLSRDDLYSTTEK